MPIKKFRDVSEMKGATWRNPGSPELFKAMEVAWTFAARVFPRHFPPGVYKHRSIVAAEALGAQGEETDFRRLWASRGVTPEELAREKESPGASGCQARRAEML